MKHKRHKDKSKQERKKLKKKEKRRHKNRRCNESNSSSSSSEEKQELIKKPIIEFTSEEQNTPVTSSKQEHSKREDWMNMKSIFPCVFNEKKPKSLNLKNTKPELDQLGQSDRELNPYWKNGGNGLPEENSTKTKQTMDINWLKKGLQRAKEQAESQNRNLEEIVIERWGHSEVIQSMVTQVKDTSTKDLSKSKNRFNNIEKYENSRQSLYSIESNQYKTCNNSQYENDQKQRYLKSVNDDCFDNSSYKINHFGKKNWVKCKISGKLEEDLSNSNMSILKSSSTGTNDTELTEIKPLTEAEMNRLGAKIVKAEIMGNIKLANELKIQLKRAREITKSTKSCSTDQVQNIILTQTDIKGITRPLEPRNNLMESSQSIKRKSMETYVSGKKVRHYFDDDKYSLQRLFQKEKGRSTNEDDAAFLKVACKNVDMDEIFEEHITHIKSDAKQNEKDRLLAIKEDKHFSKCLDNCNWCIDSKYMLKHMIVTMDSEICLSLPRHTSLTVGHCIITPIYHIACQLQLDENVWEKLKLECVPLTKEIGELAPIYFKKALLECETEWSMNKKVIDLEHKNVRQAVPNGLSYFMVEFETNKGYAHIIEDEHMFPKNFAEVAC
ncbi:CWF19-like protein 2 [Eufriesea mexicana]|nr:CWF19-like protein 2 [Eufriesea mexicana]